MIFFHKKKNKKYKQIIKFNLNTLQNLKRLTDCQIFYHFMEYCLTESEFNTSYNSQHTWNTNGT